MISKQYGGDYVPVSRQFYNTIIYLFKPNIANSYDTYTHTHRHTHTRIRTDTHTEISTLNIPNCMCPVSERTLQLYLNAHEPIPSIIIQFR